MLPGKTGARRLAAGGPAGDRGGVGEAVDHGQAEAHHPRVIPPSNPCAAATGPEPAPISSNPSTARPVRRHSHGESSARAAGSLPVRAAMTGSPSERAWSREAEALEPYEPRRPPLSRLTSRACRQGPRPHSPAAPPTCPTPNGADRAAVHPPHGPSAVRRDTRPAPLTRQGSITSPSHTRKSMSAGVDIGWRCSYGFSRSRDRAGPGRHELAGGSNRSCSAQDGAVVEFRSQSCCRTATGLTTGPGGPQ